MVVPHAVLEDWSSDSRWQNSMATETAKESKQYRVPAALWMVEPRSCAALGSLPGQKPMGCTDLGEEQYGI